MIDLFMGVLTFVPIIASVGFYIFYIYLKLTLGRQFEKLFRNIHNVDTISIYGHKEGRFDDYMELIVNYEFHKKKNTSLYKTFKGYNFREHITKNQYLLVKAYRLTIFIWGTSLIIWAALMLLIYHTIHHQI